MEAAAQVVDADTKVVLDFLCGAGSAGAVAPVLAPLVHAVLGVAGGAGVADPPSYSGVPVPVVKVAKGVASVDGATVALATLPALLAMARVCLGISAHDAKTAACCALAQSVFDVSKLLDPDLVRVHVGGKELKNKSPGLVAARCLEIALHAAVGSAPHCRLDLLDCTSLYVGHVLGSVRSFGDLASPPEVSQVQVACSDLALHHLLLALHDRRDDIERCPSARSLETPLAVVLCSLATGASSAPFTATCKPRYGKPDVLGCLDMVCMEHKLSVLDARNVVSRAVLVEVACWIMRGLRNLRCVEVITSIPSEYLAALFQGVLNHLPEAKEDLVSLVVMLERGVACPGLTRPWAWLVKPGFLSHLVLAVVDGKAAYVGDLTALWRGLHALFHGRVDLFFSWDRVKEVVAAVLCERFEAWCKEHAGTFFATDLKLQAAQDKAQRRVHVLCAAICHNTELAACMPDSMVERAHCHMRACVTPVLDHSPVPAPDTDFRKRQRSV